MSVVAKEETSAKDTDIALLRHLACILKNCFLGKSDEFCFCDAAHILWRNLQKLHGYPYGSAKNNIRTVFSEKTNVPPSNFQLFYCHDLEN